MELQDFRRNTFAILCAASLFAASATRDMRIEGDIAVLMRNLGCVTRQVELLRQVGVPQ